ncbi:MAG: SAM-dependent methyltransferase, partial [Bacteroidaceae bacterium]|nr:SAM-dependent methyltransferase [Bacteroidaceae bacterium]
MNDATLDYIRRHASDDVRQLALRPVPDGVVLRQALTQIEGRQLAARKLPAWAATDGLLFPPRLSLEQCSSEATAQYKQALVRRLLASLPPASSPSLPPASSSVPSPSLPPAAVAVASATVPPVCFVDLTAGFGVDFAALAPLFARATYVERQEVLCDIARHNLPLLGLPDAEVRCSSAEEVLQELADNPVTLLFLDPARRDAAGRKVALIEDCTPDVCALQDQLRAAARFVLIKLSPMLDLTAALRSLQGVVEAHVVSVDGECKELLLLLAAEASAA